jgi:cyclic pyranopterin phosphate synthase
MSEFSHLDASGQARMVDVGHKPVQVRTARASAELHCQPDTLEKLARHALPKGDVLAVARIAGIQAAKRTADLIPLCHTLPLDQVTVDFETRTASVLVTAAARTSARTGVEMEALTAASVAALTLYDMLKAVDTSMRIDGIHVIEKRKE